MTTTGATGGAIVEGVTRFGIMGGTFDPPHVAHLALAAAAREALTLDRVLFIPAGDPWRKAGRSVTPATHRLAMVEAAVAHLDWVEVSRMEIERNGPTYTLDTVGELTTTRPGAWWLIIGEDALLDLPMWHQPQHLIMRVRLAVARRDAEGVEQPLITDALRAGLPGIEDRVDVVPMPRMDVSATNIRSRIESGLPTEGLLPDTVRAYIDEHGLYRE
ncbi:MAG: nicotinate-nucleotide adenylyltransferase [Chloroflexi bacterium]|nr:nicotinate-nucleotide adenylyltransferase [Chloroflexota bacterium]